MNRVLLPGVVVLALALPAQDKDTYEQFLPKLTKVLETKDEKELDRLIKSSPHNFVLHYEALIRDVLGKGRPETKATCEAMAAGWKKSFETETLERVERYWSGLGPDQVKRVDTLVGSLTRLYGNWEIARKENKREGYVGVADDFLKLAQELELVGHAVRAAEAWQSRCGLLAALPAATLDDRREAVAAMENFKSNRERWNYTKDLLYLKNLEWIKAEKNRIEEDKKNADKRKAEGYAENVKGADAFVMPGSKEEIQQLEFKALAKPGPDFFVRGGMVPVQWYAVELRGGDLQKLFAGPQQILQFHQKEIFVVRPAMNRYGITLNGTEADPKKMVSEEIKLTSNASKLEPTVFHYGANKTLPYAFFFYAGGEQEQYMGIKQNLAAQPGYAKLLFKSAASWTCTLQGEPVVVYDDNCNGKVLEEDPLAANVEDLTLEANQRVKIPAFDSIQVGKAAPQPFSSWLQIGPSWYHVRPYEGATKVGVRQLNPEYFKTGTLTFKWTGPPAAKPEVLVVRHRGQFVNANFNIAAGTPVNVPEGEYELAWGRLQSGKGDALMTAQLFKGKSQTWKVEPGKATEVKLGGPFHLEWERREKSGDIAIDALFFKVLGVAGEQYGRLNGAPPTCEVLAAKAKDGKGSKVVGEFVAIPDADILNAVALNNSNLGTEVGFFPVAKGEKSTALRLKPPFPNAWIALASAKHKLFGKLEPVWKDK